MVGGEPAEEVGAFAIQIGADLIVGAIADRAGLTAGGRAPRAPSHGLYRLQFAGCPERRQRRSHEGRASHECSNEKLSR